MWIAIEWSPFSRHTRRWEADAFEVEGLFRGVNAMVIFDLAVDEHHRRVAEGAGAESRMSLLSALARLPKNSWQRLDEVTRQLSDLLRSRPDMVETALDDAGSIYGRRRIEPPLAPRHVYVRDTDWKRGLGRVGRFAGYSARTLVVCSDQADLSIAQLEASYFGVGLQVDVDGEVRDLVAAAPFMPERFTAASWLFAEQIYERWIKHEAV